MKKPATPKRKKTKRPNERTIEKLTRDGIVAQTVEKWVPVPDHPAGGVRRDLFGIIDVIAIRGCRIVGIQSTSYPNLSSHVSKAYEEPRLVDWLAAGGLFEIWAWKKHKLGKQNRYELIVKSLSIE